jgi:transglutaminase-like putative cysteine protease
MMRYRVTHTTTYEYTEPVSVCQNLAHLRPRQAPQQICHATHLVIHPAPAVVVEQIDYFGNPTTYFAVQEPHRQLSLTADHHVEIEPKVFPDPGATRPWEEIRDMLLVDRSRDVLEASQFIFDSRYAAAGRNVFEYARNSFGKRRPILEGVLDLTGRIYEDFEYDTRATTISTPLDEVLAKRRGVCQDFAHLQIACLRSLGLAARYVSGYLRTNPLTGEESLVGADATHAWLSVFCPGLGWVDVDPTNNQIPGDAYVLLAWGRDYDDVSPVKGVVLGGGQHSMNVAVRVESLGEEGAP